MPSGFHKGSSKEKKEGQKKARQAKSIYKEFCAKNRNGISMSSQIKAY